LVASDKWKDVKNFGVLIHVDGAMFWLTDEDAGASWKHVLAKLSYWNVTRHMKGISFLEQRSANQETCLVLRKERNKTKK